MMTTTATQTTPANGNGSSPALKFEGSIELRNQVGMRLFVKINTIEEAYAILNKLGPTGWYSGDVRDMFGRFPLDMADIFNWSLIGGREAKVKVDGQETDVVFQGGHMWTRREFDADPKKKMPAKVKYSRGAKPTDPPEIREKGQGDIEYVTLITFSGKGPIVPGLCKPGAKIPTSTNHN